MRSYSALVRCSYLLGPMLILGSHVGVLLLLATGLSMGAFLWGLVLYLIRMLATTAIYHRLLTHRSYQAPRIVLWVGSLVAASASQMGPSWWKAHHLAHHRDSDRQGDPHSPNLGGGGLASFLWSQGGWLLSDTFFPARLPSDVERDPVLRVIDRFHFVPVLALAGLSYSIGGLEYLGAFFLSTTVLFHAVQTVNSCSHLWGQQPFFTQDDSRNNPIVALLTLGEGWHNLHHAFPYSCRHGLSLVAGNVKRLPDPTFAFILGLARLGLASELQVPGEGQLLARGTTGSGALIRSLSPG